MIQKIKCFFGFHVSIIEEDLFVSTYKNKAYEVIFCRHCSFVNHKEIIRNSHIILNKDNIAKFLAELDGKKARNIYNT